VIKMDKDYRLLIYVFIISILAAGIMFFTNKEKQDVEFCRDVIFKGMIEGKASVGEFIDWNKLIAVGVDVGAGFAKAPNEAERRNYKEVFIRGVSLGFAYTGGKPNALADWRIFSQTRERVVIAADYRPGKRRMLFTLAKGEKRKLVGLEVVEIK